MRSARWILLVALVYLATPLPVRNSEMGKSGSDTSSIPKTWDERMLDDFELPLVDNVSSRKHVSSEYYYRIPVRPIYRSYAVYAPGREPAGYIDWLFQQEPEIVWDIAKLKTNRDWIEVGKTVFESPIHFDETGFITLANSRDPKWFESLEIPVASDGTAPFMRYVVRQKGRVEIGVDSCATCHTRVMPDGAVIKGAQGNFPYEQAVAFSLRARVARAGDKARALEELRRIHRRAFRMPWQHLDENTDFAGKSVEEIASAHDAIPPGVVARVTTSLHFPVATASLIGLKPRRYLDHTGHVRHRNIGDLMRYAALVQGILQLDDYLDPSSHKPLPDPSTLMRYGDDQLYALALYVYSLKPPPNPNRFDDLAARGKRIFDHQGCPMCHPKPLYSNNKLIPVNGFEPPKEHMRLFDILPISVGTDSGLGLMTRKGTGYYKVPSLEGVWYRGPLEHMGSVATLEDWFDPRRLRDDYIPTGFRGFGVKARAVKGHEFGLDLSPRDRKALIAFLKTL